MINTCNIGSERIVLKVDSVKKTCGNKYSDADETSNNIIHKIRKIAANIILSQNLQNYYVDVAYITRFLYCTTYHLPPSSKVTGVKFFAAAVIIIFATEGPPV